MQRPKAANISELSSSRFDVIIDVRTPAEYELDHIPGAINFPVLDNEQRILIGTLHKTSPFEARRLGAALISRNVATILEVKCNLWPKIFKPLIYCWRGGLRSGSLAIVMAQVGWQVHQLTNGYKAYRHDVLEKMPGLVAKCVIRIVSAPTGSGKTHFLYALQRAGKQVIDLEGLACHRGSVLGKVPGEEQPSQRLFESRLLVVLQNLDFSQPIYVESEGSKIGNVCVPDILHKKMQENPELLIKNLSYLSELHSKAKLEEWNKLVRDGEFTELVTQLLVQHYDPCYQKSLRRHYPQIDSDDTVHLTVDSLLALSLDEYAKNLII